MKKHRKNKIIKPSSGTRSRLLMRDLARRAGVSTSTVSRALSNSDLVAAKTRERIQEMALEANYIANSVASNLRFGTSNTIAVVVPYESRTRQSFADPFFHSMIGNLADVLTERGHEMLLVRLDAERLTAAAELVDSGRAAGIILIGQWRRHDQLNAMAERKVPLVVWGAQLPQQRYCTVGSDNRRGGHLAADHLLGLGCRRILFLGDLSLPEVSQRYRGFVDAHREHHTRRSSKLQVDATFLPGAGKDAVNTLLNQGIAFDSVFAASDLLAMSAIGALRGAGLKIPHDIPVIGYDDVELAAHFSPPLSSVHQPIDKGALALVDALMAILDGGHPDSRHLPARLVVRESSILCA